MKDKRQTALVFLCHKMQSSDGNSLTGCSAWLVFMGKSLGNACLSVNLDEIMSKIQVRFNRLCQKLHFGPKISGRKGNNLKAARFRPRLLFSSLLIKINVFALCSILQSQRNDKSDQCQSQSEAKTVANAVFKPKRFA